MAGTKKDSIGKMVLVLTVTCVIAGICLSFTYTQTKDAIANAELAATLKSVRKVLPAFDGEPAEKKITVEGRERTFYIGHKDGAIVGVATTSSALGYGGTISILVGMDMKGSITGIELLQHKETPGLGTKAGDIEFLAQFNGAMLKDARDEIKVKKDDGDIDSITAATITSRAIAAAATDALRLFIEHKDEVL